MVSAYKAVKHHLPTPSRTLVQAGRWWEETGVTGEGARVKMCFQKDLVKPPVFSNLLGKARRRETTVDTRMDRTI